MSVLLLLLEENLSFHWNVWISSQQIFGQGPWIGGDLFIKYYILSEPIHLVGSICFQHPILLWQLEKNIIKKRYCNRNAGRFFCPCCIVIVSLWTLGHFPPVLTQKKLLFRREKEPHAIALWFWPSPFWLQPFASALVSVNLRDDGTARAGCLFLHRTVFGGGEGKGGGCLHFDAKTIRHAWHYSWLCGWGLGERGSPTETLRPNVTKSDFRKWKVRNAAPAAQAHAHPTFMPQQRADPKLWGVGWRMRGQRFLCKMCTLLQYGWGVAEHWPSNVACRAARGPSQRANAGQYMRGGSGGRSVCKSHMLSPCKAAIEVDRDGEKGEVMLMSQLMEMSCQDCVGLRSRRSWRIRPKPQWWHRSSRPCLQKRCSI